MVTRRQAREWVLQLLFQLDMNPGPVDKALGGFWGERPADAATRRFVHEHVAGVRTELGVLDGLIARYSANWDIKRMAVVERNVMRMAIYEMMHRSDIPPAVSINEAVDISKYFSRKESGSFVNGILDRIRLALSEEGSLAYSGNAGSGKRGRSVAGDARSE